MNFVSKFDGVLPLTGNHPKAQLHVDTVSTKAPVDAIIVQDAQLLFTGDFKRSGSDLVISKGDHELRLEDYFKGDKHAPLASPDGAYLTGGIVDALVGHVQMAQADGSASAAKIIGHVTKLTGNATVVRNGVSIILNNGDNVHQGDVVQSGSNSTLGITFIDGSVFGLASNAKMVLNEMVYDPNGSTNTSLMSLVAGTITFVAGATAKHGDMKVDTPVATMGIRGTACVVEIEFDLLSVQPNPLGPQLAPPVKFQVLVEPDGTSGSYVLLDRTTLAPIATVNQPGTVTTVSGTGAVSFLASAQLSPELMKLITDVFSQKFTDNANPKSDTHFTDIGVLQNSFGFKTTFVDPSIGVVQVVIAQGSAPSAPPPPPGTLDHIPGPPDVFAESKAFAEKLQLTGSSLIDSATGKINYSDINAGDTPSARTEFGKFSYKDANGNDVTATLTAAQLAAIKSAEVPLVVVQDPSHLNHGAATWTYNIKDGALDFLAEGETLTLTYRALVDNNFAPANETGYFDFTITITGTNDAPTIVANLTNATGGVVEDSNVNASGNITADGIITFNDVDLTDVHAASFVLKSSHATASLPGFADGASVGTFKLTPISETPADADTVGSFGWNFTLDDANPILQSLAEGQTITLVYTVTVSDGHGGTVSQDVTITVTGSNDSPNHAPTIVGELTVATGDVTEDVNPNASNELAAAGTITFRDVDLIDTHTATFVPLSSSTSTPLPGFTGGTTYFGTFELAAVNEDNTDTNNTGSVGWTFTIDNALTQQLAVGQVVTEVYRVTISDNHGASVVQDVTVTITGTEDAPTIVADSTTASGGVVEDGQQTASGTITFQDVDLIDSHVIGQTLKGGSASVALPGFNPATQPFGTLSLTLHENVTDTDNFGTVDWKFTIDNALAQQLAVGQDITQTFTVSIDDQHGGVITQDVTVTITGTEDAPTIVADSTTASGGVVEDGQQTASGTITFQDVDLIDGHVVGQTLKGGSASVALPGFNPATQQLGTLSLTLHENTGDTDNLGTVDWKFTIDNALAQQLAAGQVITQTYTVSIDDQHGGVITQDVTVTITGTEDAPTIVADLTTASGGVVEDGQQTASGTITFQDVDLIDTHVIGQTLKSGSASVALPGFNPATQQLGTLVLTLHENTGDADNLGTVDWKFTIDNALAQQLAVGQVITQIYTVSIDDQHGGVITQDITVTITGTEDGPTVVTNEAPTIVAASTTASGGVVEDGQQTTSGTITFQDVDLIDSHVIGQTLKGGSASVALPGFNPATQQLGTLALTLHENTGDTDNLGTVDWKFTIDNALAQQLAVGQVITQTYTVSIDDQHGGVITQDVTVTITGTEDAPTIVAGSTTASGAVVEDGQQTASGTITFQDVDLIDTHVIGQTLKGGSASVALPGFNPATQQLGTLALTLHENTGDADNLGTVDWKFTIDNALAQQLAAGQVITQTYTVSIDDQHGGVITQDITVTITGTEDGPTIVTNRAPAIVSSLTTIPGLVVEDGQQTTSGTITFQDVDLIDTHVVGQTLKGGSASVALPGFNPATQQLGTLALTLHEDPTDANNFGTVDWKFTLDNAMAQRLAVGQVITQTYTVSIDDQHGGVITQDVTVTIVGTEDAPTIVSGLTTAWGGVVEDVEQCAFGTITFKDVDLIDTHVIGQTLKGGSASVALPGFNPATQQLGTLELTLHENTGDTSNLGTVDWKFTLNNALAQQLAAGQVITQTYTVSIDDQHGGVITQDVTVLIAGTNDAPVITSAAQGATIEVHDDGGPPHPYDTASGKITFTDVDLIDVHTVKVVGLTTSGTTYGLPPKDTMLSWLTLGTFNDSTNGGTGSRTWSFSAPDSRFHYLDEGQHVTLTYTILVSDGHGGFDTQQVAVTITDYDGVQPVMSIATAAPSSAPSVLGVSNDQVLGIHDTETIGPNDTPPASPAVNNGLAGVEKIGGTPEGNPQHLGAFDVVTTDRSFSHTADQASGLGDHDTFLPTNPPPAGPAVNAGLAVTHDFGATPTHADAPVPDNFLTGHADQFVFRTGGLMGSGKSADFAPGDVHVDLPALFQHTDDSVTAWLGSHAAASPGGGADLPIAPGNVGTAAHVNPAVSNPEADHFIHSQHIVV